MSLSVAGNPNSAVVVSGGGMRVAWDVGCLSRSIVAICDGQSRQEY